MRYGLLGPLQVISPEGAELPLRGAKQRALLAWLLLARGEVVPADRLAERLWGDEPPGNPANALQAQVTQLRRLLGADAVVTSGSGYAVPLAGDDLDLNRFERLCRQGRRALEEGDPQRATQVLAEALELWRGAPLADVAHLEAALPDIARLEELRSAAIESRLEAEIELGRHTEVVGELERLVAQQPMRERLSELLMLALYRSGRQADALRAYQQARDVLVEELGIDPGPGLRTLEAKILAHDPALAPPDQERPTGNVPAAITPFVGRVAEISRLREATGDHRLVTVVGPGGAGKTRLALEVARADPPAGGAWLVPLESVTDPDGLLAAVATALDVHHDRDGSAAVSLHRRLTSHLSARPTLLVLDNCEHLVGPAARLASDLLGDCPTLRIIATSREGLGVPGEALVPLGPLSDGDSVELFTSRVRAVRPDIQLDDAFLSAAAQICGRLDGLPLAIELAAARARALPVQQIADRLSDRFRLLTGGARTALPRQQTLRAVVDWSHDLLVDDERRLFRRLSVFTGGCTLDAAESVCADDALPSGSVLDLLGRLVEKSLLFVDTTSADGRYRMLQTLWQYAREQLVDAGEAEILRRRHAHHFLEAARRAEPALRSGAAITTREQLSADLENVWAALDWLVEDGDTEAAVDLADAVGWLWFLRGDWSDGVRFCTRALAAAGPPSPSRGIVEIFRAYYLANAAGHRAVTAELAHASELDAAVAAVERAGDPLAAAKARLLRANLAQRSGDLDDQDRWSRSGLEAAQACGDQWLIAAAEMIRALSLLRQRDVEHAASLARRCVDRFAEIGDHSLSIEARTVLLTVAELEGRLDDARTLAEEVVALADDIAIPGYQQWALSRLGFVRSAAGDTAGADAAHLRSLRIGRSRWGDALARIGRGIAARQEGRLDDARAHLAAATETFTGLGADAEVALALVLAGWVELDRSNTADARHLAEQAFQALSSVTDLGVAAMASEVLAGACLAEGRLEDAERFLQASATIGIPAGHGIWLLTRRDSARIRDALATRSGSPEVGAEPS
jgi:predicted ATPase/DNA-binding SARP family transcriptional activator